MSGDLRGFEYGLEPVRRRRQWQLEAAQARLGRIESVLAEARDRRDSLSVRHKAAQQEAAQALIGRVEPDRHRQALAWLAWQRSEIDRFDQQIGKLESDRDAARREVLALQLKCELIEAHREDAIADFTRDALRRQAVEADRDWLMREASIECSSRIDMIEGLQ